MYTCLVCGNSSYKTKYTRPELVYHRLPSNPNLRKIWLEVLRIGHYCSDWQCVCGDHFLKENYRPGKRILFRNTIPQPYDQKCDQNGFPNNYTIQMNDVETGNNGVLPMEQNIIIKEEDTVVNNFKTQRRSGRKLKSTRINEDMNYYEYLPRPKIEKGQTSTVIETDVKPVLTDTKDRSLKYGPCCSVKKCFNRYSKELSFFGYPRDLTLRKKWIAKSGLVVSPTAIKIINRYKVCSVHFDDDCFKNTKLKNRLKPGAIPTLFVADGIIESRNIPLTNPPVNSGFVHINKSSCSSSNYDENVESEDTPSLVYNNSTYQVLKSSVPPALPLPIDAWQSASNARKNLPGIIELRNIRLTNSPVNSEFVHINKSSCSSSNYDENVESEDTPSLVYNNSTYQVLKSSVPPALPLPIDAWQSASNARKNLPGIIELRNIPLTNSPVNSEVVHINKSSCSPSNYDENVESKYTPSLVYNNSTYQVLKSSVPPALPLPIDAWQSASNARKNLPGIIELRNIPLTNSPVNSEFVHINKSSCSSSNYDENVESEDTPSLVYNNSTYQVLKSSVPPALPLPIDAWQSASNARKNLPGSTDIIEMGNFPSTSEFVHIYKPSSSSSDYLVNVESNDTLMLAHNTSIKDFELNCSIPGCTSNITNTDEELYLFAPTIECVNKWSSALGLQLNVNCCICERHFRPQDLISEQCLVDGLNKVVKLLVHSALPIPINDVGLASNARNNLPDNTDKCSKSNTSMTIDNFSNIDSNLKQKLKNISAKNSLSITLEPIEKSKATEPSVDLFSRTSAGIKTPVISKCISLAKIPDSHNSSSNKNNPTSKTFSLINNMEYFERH